MTAPKNIRCWACRAACSPSFRDGKWWYSMTCEHSIAMEYDHDKWESERAMDTASA